MSKFYNTIGYYDKKRNDPSSHWKDVGTNYKMERINKGLKINDFHLSICEGVKIEDSKRLDLVIPSILTKEEEEILNKLHDEPLVRFDINNLNLIALKILNIKPGLNGRTVMGWKDYENKSKDSNYYSGTYILADGNKYTICKKEKNVEVYAGEGDHCLMWAKKLPLIHFKIDTEIWAKKLYEKENVEITIIN